MRATLHLDLDAGSPVPLYHQISEAIRYRIATGALPSGTVLPPLREAAAEWGANLHTVRRAYVELARAGLVDTQVPRGTVVLPGAAAPEERGSTPSLDRFAERVEREAREKHGLGLDRLIDVLRQRAAAASPSASPSREPTVYVVECSETQSVDLAAQLAERWRVDAVPWRLDRPAPPGRGPVIATYFHFSDIRAVWPGRVADVRFLGIHPDPALAARLERPRSRGRGRGGPVTITFCEREESMLHNIAVDLAALFPPQRYRVVPRLVAKPAAWFSKHRGREPVLFSPRVWGELPETLRADPRAFEARYVFEAKDLEAIGPSMKWRPR